MVPWITKFLKSIVGKWNIQIREGGEEILEKKIDRGILQGDSLSLLLFVLCMDPLSRKLNSIYPKVEIEGEEENYLCNHLLFVDDLKLIAKDETILKEMMDETKRFFTKVGLEMNKEKSATNSQVCAEDAKLIEGTEGYKYLGITEDSRSRTEPETMNKIKDKIKERLSKTRLNGKNLMKGINEHVISLINYYVGVLEAEPEEYGKIDEDIRRIVISKGYHVQPSCKERLYMARDELGRVLQKVELKSELMILELKQMFERRKAILKAERSGQTRLANIEGFLKAKYEIKEEKR